MLGLILIYFVGKAFYDLAGLHGKSQWGFAILGIVSYYAGTFIGGIAIGVLAEIYAFSIDDTPTLVIGFLTLPAGVLTCWGTYKILERQWSKPAETNSDDETLDSNLMK